MKKLYVILALMVLLFAGAYIFYGVNLESSEEIVTMEASLVSEEEVESELEESLAEEVSDELADSSTVASDEVSESESAVGWQGPDSQYLNADGDLLQLSDNYGKGTLINIWASWCEPCRVEMPYFEAAYQTYGDDINFLMIDALDSKPSETQEAALAFFDEMDLSMPIYFDQEMNNQYLFGATILPLSVILDDEGKVVEIVRGQVSQAKLKQIINKIN